MTSTFNHFNASEQVLFGSITTPLVAFGAITPENLGVTASVVIQDITYTAVNGGVGGNSITIQYIEDGIAGFETVNVSGTAIVVHIGNHTVLGSTATQVRTVLLLSPAVVLLIVPVISGTASNIQLAISATPLMGGITGPVYVSSIHADSNPNLMGSVQLISGTNVTLSQIGQAITINATGELSQILTSSHIFVGNGSNIATDTAMTGDVSITNVGVTIVGFVGGSSAANIHSAELSANAATNLDTSSTIVKRDSSGNFNASTITASLTGHASLDLALTGGMLTGSLGIGESPVSSAILDVASTTQGFLPPRMTTTQRTAISSPAEGLQVYDLTVHQLYQWNGSSWVILG